MLSVPIVARTMPHILSLVPQLRVHVRLGTTESFANLLPNVMAIAPVFQMGSVYWVLVNAPLALVTRIVLLLYVQTSVRILHMALVDQVLANANQDFGAWIVLKKLAPSIAMVLEFARSHLPVANRIIGANVFLVLLDWAATFMLTTLLLSRRKVRC